MSGTGTASGRPDERLRLLVVDALTHFGGAHRVMTAVLPRLSAVFDIAIVDIHGNTTYRDLLKAQGLVVSDLALATGRPFIGGKGTWKRPFLVLAGLPRLLHVRWRLSRFIREWNPDVVYTNQQPMLKLLATLPEVRRRCFVWHCHGLRFPNDISPITRAMLNRRGAAAIAVSQSTGEQLSFKLPRSRIHICHNGVAAEEVERLSATGPSAPLPARRSGEVVFLMPATLQRNKGQHLAVQALAAAAGQGLYASLWLAGNVSPGGDPRYVEELRAKAEVLGLTSRLHFLGWRDDIGAVMSAADVVMLASLDYESFGLGLAEAMVLGKACIGPRLGGVAEVIEDQVTGLTYEPGSVDQMAGAMIRMAEDAFLRESFGKAGRVRAMRLFSIGCQVEKMEHILKDLCSSVVQSA